MVEAAVAGARAARLHVRPLSQDPRRLAACAPLRRSFHAPEQFAPFSLAPGLCYANTLENAASAMEVAALAGKNCALLTGRHLVARDAAAAQALRRPGGGAGSSSRGGSGGGIATD